MSLPNPVHYTTLRSTPYISIMLRRWTRETKVGIVDNGTDITNVYLKDVNCYQTNMDKKTAGSIIHIIMETNK